MRRRPLALLLSALPGLAAAQATPPVTAPALGTPVTTEPVVVTGTRIERAPFDVAASVDRIDGEALRNGRLGINLTETLSALPGLAARDRQNFAQDVQLSIRGFGARASFGIRGVRVIVDGIPATLPDGQGQVSHIDLATAQRIEVLRGPFSALYGNSSGGVIQVFTQDGGPEGELQFGLAGGSDGLRRSTVGASGQIGEMGVVASYSHLETDGTRAHSAAQRDGGNLKLTWRPDADTRVQFVANAFDQPAQDPLGLTRAQFDSDPAGADPAATRFDTRKNVDQAQAGVQVERRFGPQHLLQWTLYGGRRHTEQFQAIPTGPQASALHPGGVIRLARDYRGSDLRWTVKAADDGAWSLVAGLSYDELDEDRFGFRNFIGPVLGVEGEQRRNERNTSSALDPYLQGSWQFAPAWRLDAGVRHSTVRVRSQDHFIQGTNRDDSGAVRFSETSPVLSLLFSPSESLRLYASAGRGFETPTLNELAYRSDGTAGLNFTLKPARSDNLELGAKWRGGLHQLQLALFETRTEDELVTRTNSGGRASFQNAAQTRRRGVELGWQARLGDWRAQASATVLDATYRSGFLQCAASPCTTPTQPVPAGSRIPGVARGSAAASVEWTPPQGWRGGVELRHSSRVPVNDLGSDAAEGYTTASAHAGYVLALGRASLRGFVRVDNLFDRRYAGSVIVNESNGRYFEPAPGRSTFAGVDLRLAF